MKRLQTADLLVGDAARLLRLRPEVVRHLLFVGVLDGRRDGGRYRVTAQSVYRVQAELERPDGAVRRSGPGCVRLTRAVG